jgi:hypothetical protein
MTGLYHIVLLPGADEQAFVRHMTDVVFKSTSVLQLTRITSGFDHQLLKSTGDFRSFAWQATVRLVTDHGYDFLQNIERVQKSVADFGLLTRVDVYTNVEAAQPVG